MLKTLSILFILLAFNSVFGQTKTDTILISDTCKIYVPQFLSPNAYHEFKIICNCKIKQFEFKLYDRWGNLKQTYTNITIGIKPGKIPSGTYYYIISGIFENKKPLLEVGYIQMG